MVKESAFNAGDSGSIPGLGRSPGEGKGRPLQYSCLEKSVNRVAWQATIHGVAKSQTRLSNQHFKKGSSQYHQRRQWHPTPVLLPGKSHGQRSLVGCSSWGREQSDTTERLHFHFPLSCIRKGNGNPFQYSCLENPRDGEAWWAAVCGIAQSRTRLKRLSSRSRSRVFLPGEFHRHRNLASYSPWVTNSQTRLSD